MKRILAFLLMICLLSCILAGCGEPIDPSTPGGDTPGGETPGGDTPGGDTPGGGDPIPPENSMTYQADFRIAGAAADTLAAALQKAGVTLGADDAAKVIYAGEDAATVAAAAKELASGREACYNDYALVCDGTSLALYGAGEYATAQAIEYLIATYVKDGKLTVPKDLSHVNKPALVDIQLGTHGAHELTVVALDKSCHNVAKSLAHELSVLPAVHIAVNIESVSAGGPFSVNPAAVCVFMEAEILVAVGKVNKSAPSAYKLLLFSLIVIHSKTDVGLEG